MHLKQPLAHGLQEVAAVVVKHVKDREAVLISNAELSDLQQRHGNALNTLLEHGDARIVRVFAPQFRLQAHNRLFNVCKRIHHVHTHALMMDVVGSLHIAKAPLEHVALQVLAVLPIVIV